MVNLSVVTHGKFCEGLLDSVEMIMGDKNDITPISLTPECGLEELKGIIHSQLEACKAEECLIFVDLFGATPFNASVMNSRDFSTMNKKIHIISGINLPILIEAKSLRETMDLDTLYEHLLNIGKESIVGYVYSE
ncbi:PTS sugar transporter subunit IIA [Enterococcus dongliensis]|uniref:PTS sugar transporter subunit IIA n=1 Tax=Enterococcus dongliensis TaxID=2559925 RepID=UPI00288F4C72|nr:PTS sugar transporter subunit IIA [Enterococcus dongliensis]MDT2612882.1 PTS sugar transporter subunit IIA [Enterococcus dongliensis]